MVKPIQDSEEAAKKLMKEAYQRGSADNITCVVVRFLENSSSRVSSNQGDSLNRHSGGSGDSSTQLSGNQGDSSKGVSK